jgi:membrane associated rhomboid family serine protease
MTPTQVGMRCPDCAGQTTKVKKARTTTSASISGSTVPRATFVLIAINIAVFIAEVAAGSGFSSGGGGDVFAKGSLYGPAIHLGDEYWRIVTYGFLHAGIIHIGFNMFILYYIGVMLEPAIGPLRFVAIYFSSLLAGAFGALLVNPHTETVGASGAIFGLMGAAFVIQHMRGYNPMQSGLGFLIIANLVLSFVLANVSIGGHIGGLIGGAAAGLLIEHFSKGRDSAFVPVMACVMVGLISAGGAILVADAIF